MPSPIAGRRAIMRWHHDVSGVLRFAPILLCILMLCGCIEEKKATLTFHRDGTVQYDLDVTIQRDVMEYYTQLQLDRPASSKGDTGAENGALIKPPSYDKKNVLTEQTVRFIISRLIEEKAGTYKKKTDTFLSLVSISIAEKNVRLVLSGTYPTFRQFYSHQRNLLEWPSAKAITLKRNADGKLLFELTPHVTKFQKYGIPNALGLSLTLKFPGKILESTLPDVAEDSTSINIASDAPTREEKLKNLTKQTIRVLAECDDFPKTAEMRFKRANQNDSIEMTPKTFASIPTTNAPLRAHRIFPNETTVSRFVIFPEAEEIFKLRGKDMPLHDETMPSSLAINVCLLPPEGRKLLWVEKPLSFICAVDNKGRDIPSLSAGRQMHYFSDDSFSLDRKEQYEFSLAQPESDANAVEHLMAQAVVVTCADFSSKSIPLQSKKEDTVVDISDLIPGAKMTIQDVESKSRNQSMIEGKCTVVLSGPPAINFISCDIKYGDETSTRNNINRNESTNSNGITTKSMFMNFYAYSHSDTPIHQTPTLIIYFPLDIKKENVTYLLDGVDFY